MKRADVIQQRQALKGEVSFIAEGEAISSLDELYAVEFENLEDEAGIDTVTVSMRGGGTFEFQREVTIDCVKYQEANGRWLDIGCGNPYFKRAKVKVKGPLGLEAANQAMAGTVQLDRVYPKNRYLSDDE